ncbi:iron-binding CDGSH zinc finger protein [Kineococcus xinjiangensis]|uniref:Iron-binding CDGSH zinc finger protein n=1 Tax=Kineococcus xinjiangensis TaxID=512762 RepID=A0A2S6IP05_9ACTN|nr:CDGSH iron-sulfur domain-containing protein [Kineococcus xinjiangensis]PPK95938.1 iron-binding CDGSH zinc finger protein [Kineococcus xinjiangensis]
MDEFCAEATGRDDLDRDLAHGPRDTDEVTVVVCPDGPLLVRGPARIVDTEGRPVERRRATVALCRCGKTGIAPYCDGAHKARSRSGVPRQDVRP